MNELRKSSKVWAEKRSKKCQKRLISKGNVGVISSVNLLTDNGFYGE